MENIQYIYPIETITKPFQQAIESNLLIFRFIEDKVGLSGKTWLEVYYRTPINYAPRGPQDYKTRVLCAQYIEEFKPEALVSRIILMLSSKLSSISQDLDGIQEEYTLTRKPIK